MSARRDLILQIDHLAARYEAAGYKLSWKQRAVGGYPFRLDVTLTDFKGVSPGGWGLSSERLEGEAFMHAPGHWILAAPRGLTLTGPKGGVIGVTGSTLHASLHGMDIRPPSFSLEGLNLEFRTLSGAQPFALSGAEKVELHLRPGPDRQGAILFRLTNGALNSAAPMHRQADSRPVNLQVEAILARADALEGPGLAKAFRLWAQAGGKANLKSAFAKVGDASIQARSSALALTSDGYLAGDLDLASIKGQKVLDLMSDLGAIPKTTQTAATDLHFRQGKTYLGSVEIGHAPKAF